MRLFWFLSKNENNNGFGAIGLNLSLVNQKLVANIHFTFVYLFRYFFLCGPGFSVFLLLLLLDGLVYVVALWRVVFAWCFSVV